MGEIMLTINLSNDEALVLFEWLSHFDEINTSEFKDEAEQNVLWSLEGKLESLLVEIVKPDYKRLVEEAKKRIINK
jgi:hypothetical protein